jgi:hypothetical protein
MIIKPMDTSYEIIWAVERKEPKKAYFELLDQPAKIIPYTPNADIIKMKSTPSSTSTKDPQTVYGITVHASKLKVNVNKGANKKSKLFELNGTIASFTNNFAPSANGCNNPRKPTTLGPRLLCIAAIT